MRARAIRHQTYTTCGLLSWATAAAAGAILASAGVARAEDRTITGAGNHLTQPNRGAAGTALIRNGYPEDYPDGVGNVIISDATRTNARTISNSIAVQTGSIPNNRNLSSYIWMWGQFLTHDLDLTSTSNGAGVNGTANISVGVGDPLGPNPIPMTRSNFVTPNGIRQQTNAITTWLDASMVYGSDATRAAALRTDGGTGAKLVTSANNLPGYNDAGLPNDNSGPTPNNQLFLAGDVRANENVGLTAMHTVFVREHNRLVDVISTQQPSLTNEQKYQLARKIVGAEMQAVTYKEFLPAILGTAESPRVQDYVYRPQANATITQSFAVAAFRFGHTTLSSEMPRVNNDGTAEASLLLRNAFFNPNMLTNDPDQVNVLLKGGATQVAQEIDTKFVDDVRNFLFGPPGAGGMDLVALNTQRGRDHGLADYRQLRGAYGLTQPGTFGTLPMPPDMRAAMQSLYGNLNNMDGYIAGLAENHIAGSSLGALFHEVIRDQFERLRDGDRLFYVANAAGLYNNGVLLPSIESIIDLDSVTLADIIAWNTGLNSLQYQGNLFFALTPGDFNATGTVTAADIDLLLSTPAGTPSVANGIRDINADGTITPTVGATGSDVDHLVRNILLTEFGDADLDRDVDIDDFGTLASRFNQSGTWAQGNFNGSALVDIDDFALLALNFNFANPGGLARTSAVPEPGAGAVGALLLLNRRRKALDGRK